VCALVLIFGLVFGVALLYRAFHTPTKVVKETCTIQMQNEGGRKLNVTGDKIK
jgi:hypothetical protein